MPSDLELVPMSIRDATAWVKRFHRHHDPPQGAKFAVGVAERGVVVGAAIVGRPVAPGAQDGWTAEVTRCCTGGTKNTASMLYGACWRAARALGYRRLITYTLADKEPGTSLRAAGWREIGRCGGGSWNRKNRPRVDHHPTQVKIRWEAE